MLRATGEVGLLLVEQRQRATLTRRNLPEVVESFFVALPLCDFGDATTLCLTRERKTAANYCRDGHKKG